MSDTDSAEEENVADIQAEELTTQNSNNDNEVMETRISGCESTISNDKSDITKDITKRLSTLLIAKSMCKLGGCQIPSNQFMIKCSKCNLLLHYECTRLPAYQLYLFTRKKYRLFICDMCIIGEIPTEILDHSFDCINKEKTKEENIFLLQRIKSLEEHQELLRQHIKDQDKFTSSKRKVENKSTQSKPSINDYEERLQKNNEVITDKQREIDQLRDREVQLKNKFKISTAEKETVNDKLNTEIRNLKENEKRLKNVDRKENVNESINMKLNHKQTNDSSSQTETAATQQNTTDTPITSIDEKFNDFSAYILEAMSNLVDKKLTVIENKLQNLVDHPNNIDHKEFSEVLKKNLPQKTSDQTSLKIIVKEAITEHQSHENNIEDRKTNIIVFNYPESHKTTLDQRKTEDKAAFIETCDSFCENNIPPSSILQTRRLGKKVEGKLRPLLVKVNSETIKRTIFGQLHKLRNMNDNNISMSHDMTKEERQRTKFMVDDAKKKTKDIKDDITLDNDSKNWIFVVRGPPWKQTIEKVRPRTQ